MVNLFIYLSSIFKGMTEARANGYNTLMQHPPKIVESNMLHFFGHGVPRYSMMLNDVKRSLVSMMHRLQHRPTFLSCYTKT